MTAATSFINVSGEGKANDPVDGGAGDDRDASEGLEEGTADDGSTGHDGHGGTAVFCALVVAATRTSNREKSRLIISNDRKKNVKGILNDAQWLTGLETLIAALGIRP